MTVRRELGEQLGIAIELALSSLGVVFVGPIAAKATQEIGIAAIAPAAVSNLARPFEAVNARPQ